MMSAHVTSNADNEGGPRSDSVASNGQAKSSRWHTAASLDSGEKIERHIPRLVFDPDSGLVCHWTAVVAAATLYNAWMIALRIAFPETRQNASSLSCLTYLDLLSDFIYLMDILVQLRTAYLQDGIPVFEPSKIRHQYISQPHFVQDLISVLPSQTLLSFLPDSVGCCKFFLCTAGAARLTRLLKFHILYKFYDLAESLTSNPHLIRVLRLFLNLAVIIHWIACLYYLLSEFEGLGSNDWVYTNATDQQRFTRKYIVCLYWSTMTLTTIGNTNSPETDIEYIFTGVIFLTGVFVFATVMGNVADVISSMNANRQEFQARMDHIKMYLTHKKVPASLQLKIKKWAEYTWSRTKATDESRLLNMLPERLRAEVAVHVHLDSLKKVKIFEQCETGFLCELVLKLRSQVFSPGDYVCRAGETGREMFIINHGKVEVLVPSSATNKDMVVAALSEGNYFGEISLLRLDGVQNRRTADVRSIGYSELLCLSRRDLMSALVEYPEAKSVLESQAKKRMRTNLQAQRAFSVDTLLRSSQDQSSVDSGTVGKDEGRGHDVSEIKAMIEDLKNANKVPGRTVWQLIARCEVLQAKLSEKEKEIDDSKQRVKDLEDLLVARHSLSKGSPRPPTTPLSCDHQVDVDSKNLLRPGTKVTKQFSQDEGRHVTSDQAVENPEQRRHQACNENMVIPDVKVTGPSLPAKCVSNEKDSSSPNCKALDEDNFIRTSKITHISYDQGAPSPCFEKDDHQGALRCGDGVGSVRIRSQNIVKNGSCYHESSYHQNITLKHFEELSFMTSFDEEFNISDSYDVGTIPEEDEDVVDEAVGNLENFLVTSNNRLPRATVEYNEEYKVAQCGTFSPPSTTPTSNVNKFTKTSINTFDPHSKASSHYEIHNPLSKCSTVNNSSHTSSNDREFKEPSQKLAPDTNNDANKTIDILKDATARLNAKCNQFSSCSLGETRDTNSKFKSSVSDSDKLVDSFCKSAGSASHSYRLVPETTGTGRSGERRVLSRCKSGDVSPDFSPDIPALNRLCSSLDRMSDLDELDEGISFLRMGSLSGCLSGDSPPRRNSWSWDSECETDEDTITNE